VKTSSKYWTELVSELWFLARPYGALKAWVVLTVILVQGALQVAGVTSIFPFLALAADPKRFRDSEIGSRILSTLPELSESQLLILAGVASIVVLGVSNLFNLLSEFVRARYAHGLGHWLKVRLVEEIVAKPWSYFLASNTGVLLKKISADVNHMVLFVVIPFLEALSRFVTAVLLVAMLLAINYQVAVGAAALFTIYYLAVYRLLKRRLRNASDAIKLADRGVTRDAQQILAGIKHIKVTHAESYFIRKFSAHSRMQGRTNAKLPLFISAPKHLLEPLAFGGVIALVLAYAAMGRDLQSAIPLLGVIGLAGYRLLPAAQLLYGQISQITGARHALDEVYQEFRREEPEVDQSTRFPRPEPLRWNREISVDHLCFAYPAADRRVISDLSFSLSKGQSIGIVGPTGSGKSTLVDLLLGLHVPSAGNISVDGQPLAPSSLRAWQAGIGYVPQDIFLIDDTVARNIALGVDDGEIDTARLLEAADAAKIRDFIEKELPGGFEAVVGERGVRLSGGQRQRIALARALYRRPHLLILDEATSALDNETEAQVIEEINSLQGSVTMVVVAHRLSTIERCDCVLELANGHGVVRPQGLHS
jgi:ABC-type multidrug transport system fused ATPase/permease subunit